MPETPIQIAEPCWYRDPTRIKHLFYGVFEGGGAKGIAYAGALFAMVERECWFRSVAGSSAGAITATLIASGLTPNQIQATSEGGLQAVQNGFWAGLSNLRRKGGAFAGERLRDWLEKVIACQLRGPLESAATNRVTFRQLFNATGIELNIVAADISTRRQLILSHRETPECPVADAVVASCSIPFAFPSCVLAVPQPDGGPTWHHTVVDGGVWANFPLFVFTDMAFRRHYGRSPVQIDEHDVLGFLLNDEVSDQPPVRGEGVRFLNDVSSKDFRAKEWQRRSPVQERRSTLWQGILAICSLPLQGLAVLLRLLLGSPQRLDAARWPIPSALWARRLFGTMDAFLGGIGIPGGGLIPIFIGPVAVLAVIVVGAWTVSDYFAESTLRSLLRAEWRDIETYVRMFVIVLIALTIIAISALTVVVGALGIAAGFLLIRPVRRILYSLVSTYVAGPGAPTWFKEKDNIVALPLPLGLTTLSFSPSAELRGKAIDMAREATLKKLKKLVERREVSGLAAIAVSPAGSRMPAP